ncbi:MAG TPA: serine/threonine-protein kinase, partial [Longimicrobiales bacterium]|nr:serine/threonine-protein kinase [Longimicrobiales bacterium]
MKDPPPGASEITAPHPAPVLPDGLEPIRPLGAGKMARVYLARELELDRPVAVKVLRPELAVDETARLRFEREARLAASISHPNVVSVHRFGRIEDGTPFLVMTYVEGRTLAERLEAAGTLDEQETRALLAQLAGALALAHRKGIVHRDVRPANVLVEEDTGRYLLADFGIAGVLEETAGSPRLTRPGQVVGEPDYASPEQLRAEKVTGQADVYSLAMLAYQALAGEAPYRATTRQQWIAAHLGADPIPISRLRPGVSPDLEDLLLRCLAAEPRHRPRAEDVVRRLAEIDSRGVSGGEVPSTAKPDRPPGSYRSGILRRRVPQIVSGTFAAGLVFLGLVMGAVDIERLPDVAFELALDAVVWAVLASGVLAWFHGEEGPQEMPAVEKWILAGVGAGWLAS